MTQKRKFSLVIWGAIFGLFVGSLYMCTPAAQPNASTQNNANKQYLNHSDTARYVGLQVCAQCHSDIAATYQHTGMGKSFGNATAHKTAANFAQHTTIYDKNLDMYYHATMQGDNLSIIEFRLEGKDTVHSRTEKATYIVGSGQHTNSHILNINGYLYQMPMTFYTQKQRWDLPPGFENGGNQQFSRTIETECMTCHNAYPNVAQGAVNKYVGVPQGIDCERCHGAGSIHVALKAGGEIIDTSKYIDYSIVNPKKLSFDLQVNLCERCHLQGNAVLKPNKTFFDFKPGQKLSETMTVFLPRYKNADDQFIMASHADRMMQSQCFLKTENTKNQLTCITCHNPHKSVQATDKSHFNKKCQSCHTPPASVCSAPTAQRSPSQDNCVGCHLPRTGTIDIPHVTVHDHYIRKPAKKLAQKTTAETTKIKTFLGLAAINDKNPSNLTKAIAYLQYFERFDANITHLDSAKKYLNQAQNDNPQGIFDANIHYYFLKKDANNLLKMAKTGIKITQITDAWTLYRIGEGYAKINDYAAAEPYLQKAVKIAPYNLDFNNKLAICKANLNQMPEAKRLLEFCVQENPKFVPALTDLGFTYLQMGDAARAEATYRKALALNPDYEPLMMNWAGWLLHAQRYADAQIYLTKIIKKYPNNAQAKQVLAQVRTM